MANINKVTVGGITYNITIPSGLTEEEQAQIRANIGALSEADVDVVSNGTYPEMTVGNATKAQTADALTNPRAIDGVTFDGSAAIVHYGVCSTDAPMQNKTVSLPGFTLVPGARITVNFTTYNNVSSPTLNVNGTGAIPMKCKTRTTGLLYQAEIMDLIYDGTYWNIVGGYSLADKPVGAHWIQYQGESTPASLFGGSWSVDTDYTGRVLVGSGTGYVLGVTGGEATHTQTVNELAAHSHLIYRLSFPMGNGGDYRWIMAVSDDQDGTSDKTVLSTGGGNPFNIMQPYKVVAVWKRTM